MFYMFVGVHTFMHMSKLMLLLCDSSIPADVEEVRGDSKEDKRKAPRQKKVQLTDKDYEEMPTENLDWEKISAEEKERMKDWARRKEKELLEQASELQFRLIHVHSTCYYYSTLGSPSVLLLPSVIQSIPAH